jgi:hypothetical protein
MGGGRSAPTWLEALRRLMLACVQKLRGVRGITATGRTNTMILWVVYTVLPRPNQGLNCLARFLSSFHEGSTGNSVKSVQNIDSGYYSGNYRTCSNFNCRFRTGAYAVRLQSCTTMYTALSTLACEKVPQVGQKDESTRQAQETRKNIKQQQNNQSTKQGDHAALHTPNIRALRPLEIANKA